MSVQSTFSNVGADGRLRFEDNLSAVNIDYHSFSAVSRPNVKRILYIRAKKNYKDTEKDI